MYVKVENSSIVSYARKVIDGELSLSKACEFLYGYGDACSRFKHRALKLLPETDIELFEDRLRKNVRHVPSSEYEWAIRKRVCQVPVDVLNVNGEIDVKLNKEKPSGWYSGLVHLWDLPCNIIYVVLDDRYRIGMLETAYALAGNWVALAKFMGLRIGRSDTKTIFQEIRYRRSPFPLSILIRLSRLLTEAGYTGFALDEIENHVVELKGRFRDKGVTRPMLPMDFCTPSGATIVSGLLCDGGIDKRFTPFYSNKNYGLRMRFHSAITDVIGQVEPTLDHKSRPCKELVYPRSLGIVLAYGLGLAHGAKVTQNVEIPEFIMRCERPEVRRSFLRQAFDDEGSPYYYKKLRIRGISLKQSVEASKSTEPPHLIESISSLLLRSGINSNLSLNERYSTKDSQRRHKWKLLISGRGNLHQFAEKVDFSIPYKQRKLSLTLGSYKG